MAHTYSDILIHLVFSTKDRASLLTSDIRKTIFPYMSGICNELRAIPHLINGPLDHVHALIGIPPAIAVAELTRVLKSNSSKWINEELPLNHFAWQSGYSAFSVSRLDAIDRLRLHRQSRRAPQKMSFQEELLTLLKKHGVQYDERYIWK